SSDLHDAPSAEGKHQADLAIKRHAPALEPLEHGQVLAHAGCEHHSIPLARLEALQVVRSEYELHAEGLELVVGCPQLRSGFLIETDETRPAAGQPARDGAVADPKAHHGHCTIAPVQRAPLP